MKIKISLLLVTLSLCSFAQVIEIPEFATGFSNPVEITNAGDSRLFVVQQTGEIRIVTLDGAIKPDNFLTLTESTILFGGERGLLGLAFHPQYATNGFFYVYYIRAGDGATVVARFSVNPSNPDAALPGSETVLLVVEQALTVHKGGTLRFGPDGYLYIGLGDGGSGDTSQDINSNLGKMLRIDVDSTTEALPYGIPPTNPYANTEGNDEIWAVGLRNPWKYSFDRHTGDLWIADVGEASTEEINHVPSTATNLNFGWHCYEGNTLQIEGCPAPGTTYTFPVATYPHTEGACSITGGYVYTGTAFPAMQHKYFFADFCVNRIGMADVDTNALSYSEVFIGDNYFTAFGQDAYGELYIAASANGKIYRVVDVSLGVNEFANKAFSIVPNPASSEFFIKMKHGNFPLKLIVADISGKVLLRQNIDSETSPIATGMFQSGIYAVSITDSTGAVSSSKLAVTH